MDRADEHTPHADEMRSYAAAFVARVTVHNRLPLDYSVASLRIVDFMVDGLRKGGAERGHLRGTLFGLSAYVGEVLVRRAGAVWVDFDADQRAYFGQPVGVRMPDGRVWNPLGKVRNRLELGGPEESLQTFYLTLHGRVRRTAAGSAREMDMPLTGRTMIARGQKASFVVGALPVDGTPCAQESVKDPYR